MLNDLLEFYNFSKSLGLDIVGTMCIPPFDEDSIKYFSEMNELNKPLVLTNEVFEFTSDKRDTENDPFKGTSIEGKD